MEVPSKIDGPVSFYAYHLQLGSGKDKIDKLFLLFGDEHTKPKYSCGNNEITDEPCYKTKDCLSLLNFLKKTFKETNICSDLFLEELYYKRIIKGELTVFSEKTDLLINDVRREFSDCLQYSKSSCLKYGNLRTHAFDLRNLADIIQYIFPDEINKHYDRITKNWFPEKDSLNFLNKLFSSKKTIKDNLGKTVKYILGLSSDFPTIKHRKSQDKTIKYIKNFRNKIQKQQKALTPSLKEKLGTPFIRKAYEEYMEEVDKYWKRLDLFELMMGSLISLVHAMNVTIDIYLFFRALRKDLNDSYIAIIYAGDTHIQSYGNFLFEIGAKEIVKHERAFEKSKQSYSKCVTIPQEVRKEIYEITSKFPKHRCSYKEFEMIEIIGNYFKKDKKDIKNCLIQTSKKHGIDSKKVLSIIWDNLERYFEEPLLKKDNRCEIVHKFTPSQFDNEPYYDDEPLKQTPSELIKHCEQFILNHGHKKIPFPYESRNMIYTVQQMLTDWMWGSFLIKQAYLAKNWTKIQKEIVANMEFVFNLVKPITKDIILYRGLNFVRNIEDVQKLYMAPSSWSFNYGLADDFAGKFVLAVVVPKGSKVLPISCDFFTEEYVGDSQQEVILPPAKLEPCSPFQVEDADSITLAFRVAELYYNPSAMNIKR